MEGFFREISYVDKDFTKILLFNRHNINDKKEEPQ